MDTLLKNVKKVLILSAHADDCEFFAGGFTAWLAEQGAEITEVIATDNGRGSFDMDSTTLVSESREIEAQKASKIIGKKEIHFLGYPDGFLDETPKNELRRIYMEWIRKVKPDMLLSFDPFASFETHPDHLHVAKAAVEAVGFAHLPLYHPEQLEQGLEPHQTPTNYWFAKHDGLCNYTHDITTTIDKKLEALMVQTSQMRMTIMDLKMSLMATGKHPELLPMLDENNYQPALEMLIKTWAQNVGQEAGFEYGEKFRREMVGEIFEKAT